MLPTIHFYILDSNKYMEEIMGNKKIVFFFCILIFGITIASLFKKPVTFSEKENRYLASKPTLSLDNVLNGSYMKEYETFITDQFIFRDQWIGIKTKTERLMLKQDINNVFFAKDDYLIENYSESLFTSSLALDNISYLQRFSEKINNYSRPINLKTVIIPTASTILTDKLPLYATPYDQRLYLNAIKNAVSEDNWVDMYSTLLEKKHESIYYRTDHHWTMLGAYYGYCAWAKSIGITPLSFDDFTITTVDNNFYGTIAAKVSDTVPPDSMVSFSPKDSFTYKITDETGATFETFFDDSALNTRDKYTYYMRGNHPYIKVETTPSSNVSKDFYNDRNLLVIKDSYAHCFVPFASNHFNSVTMIDLRYYKSSIEALLEENNITDILILYSTANFAENKNVKFMLQ